MPEPEHVEIIGSSSALLDARSRAIRVACTSYSVLLVGESGTGKELHARVIHHHSDRARGPFVAVNCGAIPEELEESELFGHERGAFTGAVSRHAGAFERAHSGTLLLDEIGDMPLGLQVKLLRVLQQGEVQPLGAMSSRKVDVRIVAATHRDLAHLAARGESREDLYYRLATYRIMLPPLRERGDDIGLIAKHMWMPR